MSQHYPDPNEVTVPEGSRTSRSLERILGEQGQIVPVLVHAPESEGEQFRAADTWQGARVLAIRRLGWPTILVETSWDEDDLG